MQKIKGGTRLWSTAVLTFGMILPALCTAQEPAATDFVKPVSDRQCDEFNHSWVVTSQHTYLSIKVTVRWAATGAKDMQEEFILAPGASRALGCASKVEVLAAEIMQF